MIRKSMRLRFTMAVLLLIGAGCAAQRGPDTRMTATPAGPVCRIAVLPFSNDAKQPQAGLAAFRIFMGEMMGTGRFQIIPEGEVHMFLTRNRLRPGDLWDTVHYAEFASQFGADVLIRGKVADCAVVTVHEAGNIPQLAMQVEMVEAGTGRILLSTFHRRKGDDYRKTMHFGIIHTLSELMAQVSREIAEDWYEKGIQGCPSGKK